YLFMHAEGRKQGSKMFGGYFIRRIAKHFGLLTEEKLRGLTVVIPNLTRIDRDELVRLHICKWVGDAFTWVAPRLERQQDATAEAAQADPDIAKEDTSAVPAPVQPPSGP
ncbi:hypothetical protein Tco_0020962, partial [Tanacetum coccineum]